MPLYKQLYTIYVSFESMVKWARVDIAWSILFFHSSFYKHLFLPPFCRSMTAAEHPGTTLPLSLYK